MHYLFILDSEDGQFWVGGWPDKNYPEHKWSDWVSSIEEALDETAWIYGRDAYTEYVNYSDTFISFAYNHLPSRMEIQATLNEYPELFI